MMWVSTDLFSFVAGRKMGAGGDFRGSDSGCSVQGVEVGWGAGLAG